MSSISSAEVQLVLTALHGGVPTRENRWSGDTHFDDGGEWLIDEAEATMEAAAGLLGRIAKCLTIAENRLGNAVGALVDAGTYCAGPEDVVAGIERVFNNRFDEGRSVGYREGYLRGEGERVALATANSELRSQLLEMEQRYGWLGWQ